MVRYSHSQFVSDDGLIYAKAADDGATFTIHFLVTV
jgi:hypothetical protein